MKLQTGKTYRNGIGQTVTIVDCYSLTHTIYPYVSEDGDVFTEDGRWLSYEESPHDLVEEVAEECAA